MRRLPTIALALALVVGTVAMPIAAADAGAFTTAQQSEDDNETDADVAPGEQLAGVVGVQEAEIDGEVAERAYGLKIASAQSQEARADVVAEQATDVDERLDELENRTDELTAAYEDGELTRGQYEARMAAVAAERTTAERLAQGTATAAAGIDAELLAERGVDAEAIQTLAERASDLDGPEVAEIARSIAGDRVGHPVDDREPGAPIELPEVATDGLDDDADAEIDADDATDENQTVSDADDEDDAEESESETSDDGDEDETDRTDADNQ